MIKLEKKVLEMTKSNLDILNHVRNAITEKKNNKQSASFASKEDGIIQEKAKQTNHSDQIDNEINKWIQLNAEKICKEIVKEEVKKIFK